MSILEHPKAQALLADAEVTPAAVRGCRDRLQGFLQRYLPHFYRSEQRELAEVVIQGKLSKLERKTAEPIAYQAGRERKPVQHFVGAGAWDDEAVMAELRRHVAEKLADPEAVLVVDGSGFPKKGTASCGVARQWCGRLGKVDNCQVGIFLAYVTPQGYAPLDRQLYLSAEWAADGERRQQTHVPKEVTFQESWRIALGLIDRSGAEVPFGWVTGDDEFGRPAAFREALRCRRLRYVLDVPSNTLMRDLDEAPAAGRRVPPWRNLDAWAAAQPPARWQQVTVGDGAKGPKVVRVLDALVQTKDENGHAGMAERLVVIQTVAHEPQTWYTLSNAPQSVPVLTVTKVHGQRHGVEELLQASKGEVGLGHYEVRSWVGWHHHMTLSLVALWFLVLEKGRVGKKNPGPDRAANARGVRASAATAATESTTDRGGGKPCPATNRGGTHLSLALCHEEVSAEAGVVIGVKGLQ